MSLFAAVAGCLATGAGFAGTTVISPSADPNTDRVQEINRAVRAARSGDEILLRKGTYYLDQSIVIENKTNLAFRAEPGTVLNMRFDADGFIKDKLIMFIIRQSADLLLEGFTCTTAHPVCGSARVVATDPANRFYDVRFDGDSEFTGKESVGIIDTCHEDGSSDAVFTQYALETIEEDDGKGGRRKRQKGVPYEAVGSGVFRFKAPHDCDFARFRPGHRLVFRYMVIGGIFKFVADDRVTVRDVTIWRCPSIDVHIAPCSSDFTFERLRICPKPGSGAIYASNADGIHVAGMTGTLTIRDCLFEGMGDDSVNVHGKTAEVDAWNPATRRATCVWRLFHRETHAMSANWALAGDELAVYNPRTFLGRGRVKVAEVMAPGEYVLGDGSCSVGRGDILINTRDYPRVRISGCTVKNIRPRGFLVQTHDVKIADCTFVGVGSAGILAAPDINNWYESGPTVGLEVKNCRFTRCALRPNAGGAICVKVNHQGPLDAFPPGVHRDIRISGCVFEDCCPTNVCVASTDGVCVEKCRLTGTTPVAFINCSNASWDQQTKGECK